MRDTIPSGIGSLLPSVIASHVRRSITSGADAAHAFPATRVNTGLDIDTGEERIIANEVDRKCFGKTPYGPPQPPGVASMAAPGAGRGEPTGPRPRVLLLVEQALRVPVASDARPIDAGRGVRRPGSRGAYDRGRWPRPRRARGRIAGTGEPP